MAKDGTCVAARKRATSTRSALRGTAVFIRATDAIDRVPRLQVAGAHVEESFRNQQIECRHHAHAHDLDRSSDRDWRWPQ